MDSFDSVLTPCPTCQGNGTYQDGQKCDDCNGRTKDVVFHDIPDLLALQARVTQLEAALEFAALAYKSIYKLDHRDAFLKKYTLSHGSGGRLCAGDVCDRLDEALSAPPLDVSPLWGILDKLLHTARTHWLMQGSAGKRCDCSVCGPVYSIPPELRALIAELAKGGQG